MGRPIESGSLGFDYDRFLAAYERNKPMKAYLSAIRGSQVVQQFLDERVGRLNSGQALDDAFEEERRNLADAFPAAASTRDFVSPLSLLFPFPLFPIRRLPCLSRPASLGGQPRCLPRCHILSKIVVV